MKSVIPLSIQETYEKHFGKEDWPEVLKKAGLSKSTRYFAHKSTDDEEVKSLLKAIIDHKNMSMQELSDVFGDFWVNDFAPRHYFAFYKRAKNAKEFLLNMNDVHDKIGSKVEGSKPPKFEFTQIDKRTLRMKYISERNLIDLVVGLVKGVGKRFKEEIEVKKLSESELQLVFEEDKSSSTN